MTRPDPTNIAVLPADQRRAAELTEACIGGDGDRFGDLLVELVDAGPERALAVTAVLARNLAVSLAAAHGPDEAVRVLQCTRFDAALADTDDDE